MKIDLHTHSTASDGVLQPDELVSAAHQAGVGILAITDHDTMDGVQSVTKLPESFMLIPGTELSIRDMHNLHLLCYGKQRNTALHDKLRQLSQLRIARAEQMVEKLRAFGFDISYDELQANGTVGRPHIARKLVEKGYLPDLKTVFDRYLGDGKCCYVPYERLSMAQALKLAEESGFVPVLAHPCELKINMLYVRDLVREWIPLGLKGIEVWHPSAIGTGHAHKLESIAKSEGLLITGGSDFHQYGDGRHGDIGTTSSAWPNAMEDFNKLVEMISKYH